MYAVIQLGSEQYKVSEGDHINTNRLPKDKDKSFTVDKVLLFADGSNVKVGQPFLKNVKVTAKVVDHPRGDKLLAFKHRRRKAWKWKRGHRQALTALEITKIAAA